MPKKQNWWQKLAMAEPVITVLTDHPLALEDSKRDNFNLAYRLGPVYDIMRHPHTRTPLAVAVYGDWGSGKTTAMKWLQDLLVEWTQSKESKGKIRFRPVWFCPWKYHTKDDLWRGLISEVIVRSIDIKTATPATVTSAAKQFGMFLGRSFIHAMAGLTLKAKVPGGVGEAELSLASVKDILDEYREASHPERAYLNDFESSLEEWVKSSLGDHERMVIFIDDLDRCMPDVALELLEALKLYLNIKDLIFVIGVDRTVIDKLVKEHYNKLGLEDDKSGHYLAKMFQVEVQLDPEDQQIDDFLDDLLADVECWAEPNLTEKEQDIFRGLIYKLAGRNPRELKRLINSALMMAAGALKITEDDEKDDSHYKFNQGLQLFFVRKILEDRYTRGSLVGSRLGDEFFNAWSKIVMDNPDIRTARVPESFIKQQKEKSDKRLDRFLVDEGTPPETEQSEIDVSSFAAEPYRGLLSNEKLADILHLLRDEDLGDLMQVPYPASAGAIGAAMGRGKHADLAREAIARKLGKKPDELTPEDFSSITKLDLSGSELSDLAPVAGLTSLQHLYLNGTEVLDLAPIAGLTNLRWLHLSGTQVSDLAPIAGLTNLQVLSLSETQVSDLAPVAGLTDLYALYLSKTQVSDLAPIAGLTSLHMLRLSGTQVLDLAPIAGLANLNVLRLRETQVLDEEVARLKKALPRLNIET